jgi:hypothetical protein
MNDKTSSLASVAILSSAVKDQEETIVRVGNVANTAVSFSMLALSYSTWYANCFSCPKKGVF